jgi:hypothetical protein
LSILAWRNCLPPLAWGEKELLNPAGLIDEPAKLNNTVFRPKTIFRAFRHSVSIGQKPDMAATFRREEQDIRIESDGRIEKRPEWNERVVLSVNDKSRHSYVLNELERTGFVIIVVSVTISSVF